MGCMGSLACTGGRPAAVHRGGRGGCGGGGADSGVRAHAAQPLAGAGSSYGREAGHCPTPLGNLGDMTERALAALRAADVVCAKDTRVTGRLLAAYGIEKRLERLDEALIGERAASLVRRVLDGEVIRLLGRGHAGRVVPGLRLVRAAREAGASVEVLPGPRLPPRPTWPAAATTPASTSAASSRARMPSAPRCWTACARSMWRSVFLRDPEPPCLRPAAALAAALPQREAAVCRELTKLHEKRCAGRCPRCATSLRNGRAQAGAASRARSSSWWTARTPPRCGCGRGRAAGRRCARRRAEGGGRPQQGHRPRAGRRVRHRAQRGVRPGPQGVSGMAGRGAGRTGRPTARRRRGCAPTTMTLEVDGLPVRLVRKRIKNVNLRVKARPGGGVGPRCTPPTRSWRRSCARSAPGSRRSAPRWPPRRGRRPRRHRPRRWPHRRAVVEACVPPLVAAWEPIMGVKGGAARLPQHDQPLGQLPARHRAHLHQRPLGALPARVPEYVVVHELCHLRERGHGQRFKDLMDTYMPDWRERRAKLR